MVADTIKVTDKMIEGWKAAMKKDPTPRLFRDVTQAFKAALATTKGEGGSQCRYKVADSSGKSSSNKFVELFIFFIYSNWAARWHSW